MFHEGLGGGNQIRRDLRTNYLIAAEGQVGSSPGIAIARTGYLAGGAEVTKGLRSWLPLAVSLVALFAAMGGVGWAKTLISGQQIEKNSIPLDRLTSGARRTLAGKPGPRGEQGAQGAPGSQGTQGPAGPSTGPAGGALTGDYPNPGIAPGAIDMSKLSSATVAQLKDHCPSGMTQYGSVVCIDTASRASGTFEDALNVCTGAGLRLPTVSEAWYAADTLGMSEEFWTDDAWRENTGQSNADVAISLQNQGSTALRVNAFGATIEIRCATTPSNA